MTHDSLAAALAAFQADVPRITKGSKAVVPGKEGKSGYSYTYADLADVVAVVLPLLGRHGLSFSARPTLDDGGRFVLAYTLRHESGQQDVGAYPLPPVNIEPQKMGSAITYARRYCLLAVTGVAPDEDDDDGAHAPAASRQPVDRHESSWDVVEQDALREAYIVDLDKATTLDDVQKIGAAVRRQVAAGDISPATNRAIADAAARRVAELQPALPADGHKPTKKALDRMFATFAERGIHGRAERLEVCARVTGRPIGSSADLTADDVHAVIVHLDHRLDPSLNEPAAPDG